MNLIGKDLIRPRGHTHTVPMPVREIHARRALTRHGIRLPPPPLRPALPLCPDPALNGWRLIERTRVRGATLGGDAA